MTVKLHWGGFNMFTLKLNQKKRSNKHKMPATQKDEIIERKCMDYSDNQLKNN